MNLKVAWQQVIVYRLLIVKNRHLYQRQLFEAPHHHPISAEADESAGEFREIRFCVQARYHMILELMM